MVACRRRYGCYLEAICPDQICRARSNCPFCLRYGIRLSGSGLGRPQNDPKLASAKKQQFLNDQRERNTVDVEGFFAPVGRIVQVKPRNALSLIREKLVVTQASTIEMNLLVTNLQKLLELLFDLFDYLL